MIKLAINWRKVRFFVIEIEETFYRNEKDENS